MRIDYPIKIDDKPVFAVIHRMLPGKYSVKFCYGTSNNVLAYFAGGTNGVINRIDYVTIASTGNATDFGDLTQNQAYSFAACSVSHGGL